MKNIWLLIGGIVVLAVLGYGGYRLWNHPVKQEAAKKYAMAVKPTAVPVTPTQAMMENSVYKMVAKGKLGTVMTDLKGMTLYAYAKDASGASNCSGKCIQNWPAYTAQSEKGTFPANITVIKRTDGTLQYAWKGMPLYYYTKDKDNGDTYGDGIGGVWAVVKQ